MKILMREDKNNRWELVESNTYAAENELQDLLATSPDVISMDEIRPGAGPLVAAVREFSLPVGYIDILAFTARGDIAIVECKLAKNTQAKREVIGQILDYAAHMWDMSYEELDQGIQGMTNKS
jgi:RecB family endonuclease NucS